MSLSSRIANGRASENPAIYAAGSPPRSGSPRLFSCHYCGLSDPDPEVVFDHMNRGDCRRQPREAFLPEWRRRARENRLPAKELAA